MRDPILYLLTLCFLGHRNTVWFCQARGRGGVQVNMNLEMQTKSGMKKKPHTVEADINKEFHNSIQKAFLCRVYGSLT